LGSGEVIENPGSGQDLRALYREHRAVCGHVGVGVASAVLNRVSPAHLVLGLRGPLQPVLTFYAVSYLRPVLQPFPPQRPCFSHP